MGIKDGDIDVIEEIQLRETGCMMDQLYCDAVFTGFTPMSQD